MHYLKQTAWYGGVGMTFGIAIVAQLLNRAIPHVSAAVFAMVMGAIFRTAIKSLAHYQVGYKWTSGTLLKFSIVLMGFGLSIKTITGIGLNSLKVTLITISVAFIIAIVIGKWLKVSENSSLLVGFGTAICGGSAIATASPILEAEDDEIALAMSTIFIYNLLGLILFPLIGHALNLSDTVFGVWSGTAINDTSSVVAAGYAYSQVAGDIATVVKLVRTFMIIPGCLVIAFLRHQSNKTQHRHQTRALHSIVPVFIVYFIVAVIVSSFITIPESIHHMLNQSSKFFIVMALAAVGMSLDLSKFHSSQLKPIMLGGMTWLSVLGVSLLLSYYFF